MPLHDVAPGVKQFQIDPVEQYKNVLTIADLAGKVQRQPFELRSAMAEANIKETGQVKAQADLLATLGAEGRAKSEFLQKQLVQLPNILAQNPQLGKFYLKQLVENGILPKGSEVVPGKVEGTHVLGIPQADGAYTVTTLDPNRVGSLEERQKTEAQLREAFSKQAGEGFQTVAEFWNNFKQNIGKGTGAADFAALFSALKMLDRSNQVGQGQTAEFLKLITNIRGQLENLKAQQTDPNAPIFGAADSPLRQSWTNAMATVFENTKANAAGSAKYYAGLAQGSGVDPERVIPTFGGVNLLGKATQAPAAPATPQNTGGEGAGREAEIKQINDRVKAATGGKLAPEMEQAPPGLPAPRPRAQPVEANVGPAAATPAPTATPTPPPSFESTLQNVFAPVPATTATPEPTAANSYRDNPADWRGTGFKYTPTTPPPDYFRPLDFQRGKGP